MKVGVLTNAFRERDLIAGCVDQFAGRLPHTVLVSNKPWHGDWGPDDTYSVAIKHGAQVQVGNWSTASEQLNYGLSLYRGFDWVIICDADERYTAEDLEKFYADLSSYVGRKEIGAIRSNYWDVYWKTPDYKIVPPQTDFPLVAIRPTETFGHIRSFAGNVGWTNAHMHHFSYVRSDEDMAKKVSSFEASKEFNSALWYTMVWEKWTPEMQNLHPVNPPQFKQAVWDPCPEEIRRLLP